MAPHYNEPRHNEDPVIKINIWKPGRITVKHVETSPAEYNEPTIQMVDRPNTTPIGQDRETLLLKIHFDKHNLYRQF